MNPLTRGLKPYVKDIEADAMQGNQHAKRIITFYQMHCACPNDPGARAFCEVEFDLWLREGGGDRYYGGV